MKVTIREYRDADHDAVRHVPEVCGLEVDDPADSREGMAGLPARNMRFCLAARPEGTQNAPFAAESRIANSGID
jgi:hypothetical protein